MGSYQIKIIEERTRGMLEKVVNAYLEKIPRSTEIIGVYYQTNKRERPTAVILIKNAQKNYDSIFPESYLHPIHETKDKCYEMKSNPYI